MAPSPVLLLVDDDDDLRCLLKEYLELNGFIVEDAANSKAALVLIERNKPDLVITDYEMPIVSGVELARYLRKYQPELPIVFVTAGLLEPILTQVVHWPYIEILRKPVSLTDLISSINRLLQERPRQIQ